MRLFEGRKGDLSKAVAFISEPGFARLILLNRLFPLRRTVADKILDFLLIFPSSNRLLYNY